MKTNSRLQMQLTLQNGIFALLLVAAAVALLVVPLLRKSPAARDASCMLLRPASMILTKRSSRSSASAKSARPWRRSSKPMCPSGTRKRVAVGPGRCGALRQVPG